MSREHLYFSSRDDGLFEIFFGKITVNRPQAIAMYSAACEPHANSFGGMALFNVVDQKFELVRYFPGMRFVDCVVAPSQRDGRQTPYCFSSFMAQGTLGQSFGPIRFKPGDFNAKERDVQKWSMSAKGMAFIRPDELQFVTMVVRFRPPSARAKVELAP